MIKFEEIKRLFPEDKYQFGVLNKEETYQLGQVKLKAYGHSQGTILLVPETERFWKKIKNSLIILQYTNVAYDYSIKPQTQQILTPHFKKDIFLITIDLKTAAIKAGLGCLGYNNLVWNPKFGFDCKITAWAFLEEIKGYQKPNLPEYLPICNVDCLKCHQACPGQAFSGKRIKEFKFDAEKCESIIGRSVQQFAMESDLIPSYWDGVPGGIPNHCRACQEQELCRVAMPIGNLLKKIYY